VSPDLRRRTAPWAWLHRRGGAIADRASRRLTALFGPPLRHAAAPADLVHALRPGYGFLAGSALSLARERGVPFVFTRMHHGTDRDPPRARYDEIARTADAVIALTDYERDVLVREKGVAPERVHVTGVGPVLAEKADPAGFRRAHDLDAPYVLFLGRQTPSKGIDVLLAAARRVWRERPEVHFVLAGPHDPRRPAWRDPDPRVRDLGAVDLETKTSVLAGCELLCLPSRKESFGGVVTEAWSFGKPVVAARIGALASVVEHGRTGLLAEPEPAPLADALLELLREPARARALGAAGRVRAAERYAWDRLVARTRAIYASLA
jgi:glycosyltransferase involved in cell wall biosynthesis